MRSARSPSLPSSAAAEPDLDRLDPHQLLEIVRVLGLAGALPRPGRLGRAGLGDDAFGSLGICLRGGTRREEHQPRHRGQHHQHRDLREPGHQQDDQQRDAHDHQGPGVGKHLARDLGAELAVRRRARDDDAGRHRDHQRGDLGDDAVAHGQQGEALHRLAPGHAHLGDADRQAADDVDQDDDDAGDRVALDELGGAIHRAVEVRLALDQRAPAARLVLVDQAHVHVGVDRHLLPGHRVEREPGGDLGHALGTVGHHHVLHDHQDQEHHDADHVVAADHELADGVDHPARVRALEDQPRRRHVQGQAQHGDQQQDGREGGELERRLGEEGDQQDQQRQADVDHQQEVEQHRRDRHEQHDQDAYHQRHQRQVALGGPHLSEQLHHAMRSFRAPPSRRR
jgi:hypothetical protein